MNWANILKIIVAAAVCIVVFLLLGCSIESPQAPSWDVPITIPLIDRSYTSGELFQKISSDNIEVADDGSASFVVNHGLEDVNFESLLQYNDVHDTHAEQIGLLPLPKAADQQVAYNLSDYVSLVAGEVPAAGVTATAGVGQPSTFAAAEFASGTLSLQVTNNTGLALDSVTVTLLDLNGAVTTTSISGGLGVGELYSTDISVAGKIVTGNLSLETYFHTQGGALLSLAEKTLDVTLSYGDDLMVSSLTGQVGQFQRVYHEENSVNDESSIISAQLKSGKLVLNWTNQLPVPVSINATFPEITNQSGLLDLAVSLPAYSQATQDYSLDGWHIEPANNRLGVDVVTNVAGSGGTQVTMSSSDQFSVEVELSDLQAESAEIIPQPTDITWNQTQLNIDVPTGFEHVSPALVELEIAVQNYSELSGTVQLNLTADNGKSLMVNGEVTAGSAASPRESIIYSDQLADLLTPIPNQIEVSGLAVVGDGATTVNLNSSDHLEATATISAPMSVKLDDATVEGDPNELNIDRDLANKADRLLEGRFQGTISNHLPLGASVSIYFATSEAELFSNPQTIIGPFTVNAGQVDGSGVVGSTTDTQNDVSLTAEDLAVFQNQRLYIAPVINLQGTNGEVVHIRAADYLDISGLVTITTRLGGKDF